MLGRYENFPEINHGAARFTCEAWRGKVQQAIASAFYRLNQKGCKLKEIGHSSPRNCDVDFEFGVGEDLTFTFLDKEELNVLTTETASKPLMFLDFLGVLQYHVTNKLGEYAPLKFDYYLLRFTFERNSLRLLVFHERGPQRVHVEGLIAFLAEKIREELAELYSVVLKLESLYTL